MNRHFFLAVLILFAPLTPTAANEKGVASTSLTIGVFPRRDPATTIRMFSPLRAYIEEKLGVPVQLETAPNFQQFEQRLKEGRYDLVHFNQYHYVKANEQFGYQALVQNEEFGEATIKSAIYVRHDSGIRSIDHLRGKTILFGGGKKAMMSYVVAVYLLKQGGLSPGDYTERFAINPPNAVLATYMRQADAAGAGEISLRLPMVQKKVDTSQLRLLVQSEPMPHLPWAVKPNMDQALEKTLQELLLTLDNSEEGRVVLKKARLTGLNPANDSDYDVHRAVIDELENGR